jgi:2-dehydro-3-deoxygluconokinase
MTDLVTFGDGVLRLGPPGSERLETAREFEVRAAGSAPATAVAAQRLGADTTWLSKLPDTPMGHRVRDGFGGTGIDTQIVWAERGRQGTYYIEHAGAPRGVKVHYDLADTAFSTVSVDDFDLTPLRDARGFYVTGIAPALSDAARETTANLLRAARQSGTTVTLDLNYRSNLWSESAARDTLTQLFPAVDVLVVTIEDVRNVLDYDVEKAPQAAHRIAADHDFTTVVVTRGERGAIAWHDSVVHDHEGYDTETIDPIGAGDAFAGAFVARRLDGDDIRTALDYATATASLERTIPGDVATVTRDEVETVVAGEVEDVSR